MRCIFNTYQRVNVLRCISVRSAAALAEAEAMRGRMEREEDGSREDIVSITQLHIGFCSLGVVQGCRDEVESIRSVKSIFENMNF